MKSQIVFWRVHTGQWKWDANYFPHLPIRAWSALAFLFTEWFPGSFCFCPQFRQENLIFLSQETVALCLVSPRSSHVLAAAFPSVPSFQLMISWHGARPSFREASICNITSAWWGRHCRERQKPRARVHTKRGADRGVDFLLAVLLKLDRGSREL